MILMQTPQSVELTLSPETSYLLSQLLETLLFHFVALSLVLLLASFK